jgi:hypothetical protein
MSNVDKARKSGGPAFPAPAGVAHITEQGMTLRDYFAAKAMPFCLKNCFSTEGAVERSYEIADAMLKERKQ